MNTIMNYENNNLETTNFDMQQLMNITGQTAMNINHMSRQLGVITSAVDNLTYDVNSMKDDIYQLKLNEEITSIQKDTIKLAALKKVIRYIGDDPEEKEKYFKIFIHRLYADTRRNAGLNSRIEMTKKRDYQRCIDYIEAWIPCGGCSSLKARADENAKARVKARQLGYLEQKKNKSNKK